MAKKNYTVQKGILNYHPSGDKKIVSGVPVQWQSKPNEPTTELAYITDKEKELLKTLNLHNKDEEGHRRLMAEMNRGPGGILSLDDSGGGVGDGPSGGEGGDEGDSGAGADVGGAGGVGTGPGGGQGAGGQGGAGPSGGIGGDLGQDDTLGEADQAAATASDFGPESGFGLSQAEAEAAANEANVAMGRISDENALVEDYHYFKQEPWYQQIFQPTKAFGLALGLNRAQRAAASGVVGAFTGGPIGAISGVVGSGLSNPTSSFSGQGAFGRSGPNSGPGGFGPDAGGSEGGSDYLYEPILQAPQAAPTLLNPVPVAPRPQYEFKRNWWEGNKFVPAPITRIT